MNVSSQLNSVLIHVVLQYCTYSTQGKIWEKKYRPVPTWELRGTVPSDLSHQTSSSRIASKAGVRTSGAVLVSIPNSKAVKVSWQQHRTQSSPPKKRSNNPSVAPVLWHFKAQLLRLFTPLAKNKELDHVAAMLATDWYEMIWTLLYLYYLVQPSKQHNKSNGAGA